MTTQKRKGSKKKRSKKYRGGGDSYDDNRVSRSSSTSSDWGLMDTDEEAAVLDPYKKAQFWNNVGYGAIFVGLATVIGIIVLKKGKL
jgi:hypothetical protein